MTDEDFLKTIMTPKEVLSCCVFEEPLIISPEYFLCFQDLLNYREDIRSLKLVPIKHESINIRYKSIDKEVHRLTIDSMFAASKKTAITANAFPYWLSEDVAQMILWVKDEECSDDEVVVEILKYCKKSKIDHTKIVIFERPRKTDVRLVRGTIPFYRHIHVWHEKNDGN